MILFISVTLYTSGAEVPIEISKIKSILPKRDATAVKGDGIYSHIVVQDVDGGYSVRESIPVILKRISEIQGRACHASVTDDSEEESEEGEKGGYTSSEISDIDPGSRAIHQDD